MEPVFRTLELAASALMRMTGMRLHFVGLENIPRSGGFVLALNHIGYTDFLPPALGLHQVGRRGRYLVKSEMMDVAFTRFLVNHTGAVPVDRSAGAAAFQSAVGALRAGRAVVVYPETTISRSFELKEFKTGAVRMAIEAAVPVVPAVGWGAHRQLSKGTGRRLGYWRIPAHVRYGAPIGYRPDVEVHEATRELRETMIGMLHEVQDDYPEAPVGADWLPARLGGSAPTPEEALVIEETEAAHKAARRAAKAAGEQEQS